MLCKYHGALCVVGNEVNALTDSFLSFVPQQARLKQQLRDGPSSFHITVLSANEKTTSPPLPTAFAVYALGLAHVVKANQEAWYIVIYSPVLQQFRRSLGLCEKEFHITLGFTNVDPHGNGASPLVDSIVKWSEDLHEVSSLICSSNAAPNYHEVAILRHVSGQSERPDQLKAIVQYAIRTKDFLLLSIAEDIGWKFVDRGYLFAIRLLLCVFVSLRNEQTQFERLLEHFPRPVTGGKRPHLEANICEINRLIVDSCKKHQVLHCTDDEWKFVKLPRNFSWMLSCPLLAGSAYPYSTDHFDALYSIGIRHIVTVHEGALLTERTNMKTYHYEVVDRTPPTVQQLKDMVRLIHCCVTKKEGVLVHCQGGVGRTNTVIIAYLMCIRPTCSASDLIAEVTNQRKLILSQSQQECLRSWYRVIHEEDVLLVDEPVPLPKPAPSSSSSSNYVKIANAMNLPPLIMLCGIPSSGKSTLSKAMVAAFPDFFVRINRDERRGKGECDELLQKGLQSYLRGGKNKKIQQCVILDGCHISKQKRLEWLHAAHQVPAWCIVFERSTEECKSRIQVRTDHPTIPAGTAGLPIIESMLKQYEAPTVSEGFSRIITISCDEDMDSVLASFKVPPPPSLSPTTKKPIKFPRTSHAINLGAATRDDKILPMNDLRGWIDQRSRVTIEEKIDGANIGFSIHPDDNRIIAQNRSHFISSQYHAQFAPLDKWIAQHGQELWTILEPGKHILYGEWLFATHSVSYNRLPDYFIAYDLFDVTTNTFLSRPELAQLLLQTTIPHVALVYEGVLQSVDHLKSFVFGPSMYGDEPREGVVIRLCDNTQLMSRAKLVRPDFIAGNERWNRSAKLQTNQLAHGAYA